MNNSAIEQFLYYQKAYFNKLSEIMFDFSLTNPFFLTIVCLGGAFAMEAFLPKQLNYSLTKRKGLRLDLFYVFIYDFAIAFLGIFAITHLVSDYYYKFFDYFNYSKTDLQIVDIMQWHPIIQLAVFFVVVDFMEWLGHYAMHRFDFLWAFHKVHHANEEVGVASSRRFHIFEFLILKPAAFIPISFLGYDAAQYAIYASLIFAFLAFFTHANAKIPLGPFNYIINSPNTHIWHHAKNIPGKYGVNFASALNIWDVLFGFYYRPENKKPELGIDDIDDVPMNVAGQFVYPFKYLITKKNASNRFDVETVVPRAERRRKEKLAKKKGKKG